MSTNTLIPDYMDIDFDTAKATLKELLAANPVFKDYDYEGANITIMIELISYLIQLNTYYMNMVAKNQYIPTANMYETTHMLSKLGGYNPMGYRSAATTLSVDINVSATMATITSITSGSSASEALIIEEWSEVSNSMGVTNPDTGETIRFVTVGPTLTTAITDISSGAVNNIYTIAVPAREGYILRYDYKGSEIIDNKIYLPINTYDYDDDIDDDEESVKVYVNEVKWTRLSDWFESSETIDNAFMFKYDKYGRYYIEFSETRNMPTTIDDIAILTIISSGENGNVGSEIINSPPATFISTQGSGYLPLSCYTVSNSAAAVGGSGPETIDEIKDSTIGVLHSQYRNVTSSDYISHLETRANIVQANVWGEQEEHPTGSVQDYNKVYISLVPSSWNSSTISVIPTAYAEQKTTIRPLSAIAYNEDYTDDIAEYIRPRKILTCYELYVVPELLYFMFKIGLKIKPNYSYVSVKTDVQAKLEYYFYEYNRTFNERISFIDIQEYILDTTITSSENAFTNIKGLRTMIFRELDIVVYRKTSPYYYNYATYLHSTASIPPTANGYLYESTELDSNGCHLYPYYVEPKTSTYNAYDNKLRTIQLGHKQFPKVYIPSNTFSLEV